MQALERIEAGATGVGQLAVELDCSRGHLQGNAVLATAVGRRPDSADLLSVFRPPSEIQGVIAEAVRLGVRAVWRQPAEDEAADTPSRWRAAVEAAGLDYLDTPPIVDAARELAAGPPRP